MDGHGRRIVSAAVLVLAFGGGAGAQTIFDHMKCFNVRDTLVGEYTADLYPKDSTNFEVQPGDTIVGGQLVPGCRIRLPAKYFCIDIDKRNARQDRPPFDPSQWTRRGPEAGDRLCYKLTCPRKTDKMLDVVDQFGTRKIFVRSKVAFLCTPVFRPASPTQPCTSGGDGQCGGTCPNTGERCLAISGEDCGCVPDSQACSQVTTCQSGRCPGLWETCGIQALGVCGCNHP